jgi:preprotein translocase subunit SecA
MLGKILKLFLGTYNERVLKKITPILKKVNSHALFYKDLKDQDLQAKTVEFKDRILKGESLDSVLPEAFAALREASERILGMRHFDVQIVGGIVLHQGNISEMKTGEGKTLVATLPIYLHALTGKGVHVVTVNDYLAKRDCEWMQPLYEFMGLTAGSLQNNMDPEERRKIYEKDIVYGVTSEFGFDYLRDNMVLSASRKVQRGHNFCIVDEVDSVLIDEARTPLIISGPSEGSTEKYYIANKVIPGLKPAQKGPDGKWQYESGDYILEEKDRHVSLTENGIGSVEKSLGISDIYDPQYIDLVHAINQALKAHLLYRNGRDYLVDSRQEVIIIDENTGRKMEGRRYGDGLHQAIEAKENVPIQRENQTMATITIQNYFKMYPILSGMTGTAETEAPEFLSIYKMDVVVVPTNRPINRADKPDVIYKSKKAKYKALLKEIIQVHEKGAPILIGTISVENSEEIAKVLQAQKIPHFVLNAKNHEKEAEIIAQAGVAGSITIATNMAGRGTDIVLGGNPQFQADKYMEKIINKNLLKELTPQLFLRSVFSGDITGAKKLVENHEDFKVLAKEEHIEHLKEIRAQWQIKHEEVVSVGGLHVLGTERHEARRIDNQLRGRAGRQGDPGFSRFYLSLEDELFRIFGSDRMIPWLEKAGFKEDDVIESRLISRMIESSQKKVEARNFEMRKHLLEYDEVMNVQRRVIYEIRDKMLYNQDVKQEVELTIEEFVENEIYSIIGERKQPDLAQLQELSMRLKQISRIDVDVSELKNQGGQALFYTTTNILKEHYKKKEEEVGQEALREAERLILLEVIDDKWRDHLYGIDELREGISLRSYGEKNPLVEYQLEASKMFETMMVNLQETVVGILFTARFQNNVNFEETMELKTPQPLELGKVSGTPRAGAVSIKRDEPKIGRNSPCPCGSGKKYKNCHGK